MSDNSKLSKVIKLKVKSILRVFAWHYCGFCYSMDPENMCNIFPEQIPVRPKRFGCCHWACKVCGNEHTDHKGRVIDHSKCLKD